MKKITLLFALLCASMMGFAATQYCGAPSPNPNFTFSLTNISGNLYRIQFDAIGSDKFVSTYNINCGVNQTNGAGIYFGGANASNWVVSEDRAYLDFTTASEGSVPTGFYGNSFCFNKKGGGLIEINSFTPSDVDWKATCESGACTDNVKPSISAAAVSDITYNSAVLKVTATDNEAVTRYVVKNGDAQIASTTNNEISLTNLSSNTTYDNIKVYAYDECNNESDVFEVDDFKTNMLQYCQFETGHQKNANFGDSNGRILLTIRQISASAVGVTVEPNSTNVFDYVEVIVAGVGKSIGTIGEDIPTNEEIVFDGLSSLDFTINVLWHHKGWDPVARWTTENFQVAQTELCNAMSSILVNANVNNVEMGTASVNKSEAEKGDEVTFTATANDGYIFVNWTAGSTIVSTNPIYTTVVDANTTLTANFRKLNNNYCNAERTAVVGEKTYTIFVTYKKTTNENEYKLIVRSAKEMTGFGGTYIRCSGENDIDIRTKGVLENKNTLSCTLESTTEPNMYTPLFVIFKDGGEVTFNALTNPEFAIACDDDNVEVESIALDPAELTLEVGKNKTLIPVFTPAYAVDQTITWQSDKESIVSVTDGVISANAVGEAVITATSANGKTATCAITVIASLPTAPLTAAPVPTWPADQVKSLYSNSYPFAPASLNSYNEGWWAPPVMAEKAIEGNNYLHYTLAQAGMIGVQFAETSIITMEYFHIDVWASKDGTITIRPITVGGPEPRKTLELVGGKWNSFDIPMADFPGHDWTKLFQYTIENWAAGGLTGEYIAVDNVFFYRTTAIEDTEKPANVTATAVSTDYFSALIAVSATDNMGVVNYTIKDGDMVLATGAAASGITTSITVPGLLPNTEYTLAVIAADDKGNAAEPVSVTAKTLAVPAPAPAPDFSKYGKVAAIYSDVAEGTPVINIGNWGQSTAVINVQLAESDNVMFLTNMNYLGWELAPAVDATDMEFLHVDFYATDMTTVNVTPISPGREGVATVTLNAGAWTSVDIPLSTYAAANIEWNNIFQVKFFNADPVGKSLFIDNVYFYKAPEAVNFADDATDNSTIVANNADKLANVTINRSILANGEWFTLCLPFDMNEDKVFEVFGNSTIATLVSSEDRGSIIHLNFDYVKTIEAGNAYMIKPGKDFVAGTIIEGVTIKNVNPENLKSTCDHMHFQGVFDQYLLEGDNKRFVAANNYLYSPAVGGTTMGAFRCYFTIPVESQALVGSKAARIVFGPQVATGTENVQSDQLPSTKVIIDGTLYIIRDGRTYNAQGQLVK